MVKWVSSEITIKPKLSAVEVKAGIESALKQSAEQDSKKIRLSPGVTDVEDLITIG